MAPSPLRRGPATRDRALAWLQAVHPFPSTLDAVVCSAIAGIAGAPPGRMALLGAAMLLLQFAIGLVNDVADAALDAATDKPGKPVARGLIRPRTALVAAIVLASAGLLASAAVGPVALLLGAAGLAVGMAYDLWLKRTPWSFVPFALGVPLLPLFAWVGATGGVPGRMVVLAALAVPAGAALAMANALADLEADAAAGVRTVAGMAGRRTALVFTGAAMGVVLAGAILTAARSSPAAQVLLLGGGATVVAGLTVAASGRTRRGWEVQALGLAGVCAGWVLGSAEAGLLS